MTTSQQIKTAILEGILSIFDDWAASGRKWACSRGCSACCTQNVTITSLEGKAILQYILQQNNEAWLAEKLSSQLTPQRPNETTNEFAAAILAGKEITPPESTRACPCPFLENDSCGIYPARPFSCRCFLSLDTCTPDRPAIIPPEYIAASTAVSQLLEHLDQRGMWGNMLDVLAALLHNPEYTLVSSYLEEPVKTRPSPYTFLRSAMPLPGFILDRNEYKLVAPLLASIFQHPVGDATVEAILNGS